MQGKLGPSNSHEERGQSYIEFVLVLPVLLLLVMGAIELALLLRAQLVLTNATREGARLASRGAQDDEVAQRVLEAFSRQLPIRTESQVNPNTGAIEAANTGIVITRFFVPVVVTDTGGATLMITATTYSTGNIPFVTDGRVITLTSQIGPGKWSSFTVPDEQSDSTHDVVFVETFYQHNLALYSPIEPLAQHYFPEMFVLYDRSTMRVSVPYVRQAIKGE
ncbi:MAG: pilus assembly protein [Anaerolineae bacterium]|nr:pilus assembly protein [Anaerolineae bacterium]